MFKEVIGADLLLPFPRKFGSWKAFFAVLSRQFTHNVCRRCSSLARAWKKLGLRVLVRWPNVRLLMMSGDPVAPPQRVLAHSVAAGTQL
jgi:hypothetical protein